MKRIICFLFVLFAANKLLADIATVNVPDDTSAGDSSAATVKAKSTPQITEENIFDLNAVFQNDLNGFQPYSLFDVYAKSELSRYSIIAEGMVRFKKNFSNSDAVDDVDLRLAKLTYLENWLQVCLGRMDLSGVISPTSFFGSYSTMGIHRLDGMSLVFPIRLSLGGEDYKGVSAPPTSISVYYFPSLLSTTYTNLNGDQGFVLGQARLKVNTDDVETTLRLNVGGSGTDYFTYSAISGNTTASAALDFKIAKRYCVYGEYGIENTSLLGTSALTLGAKAEHLASVGPFALEALMFEVQQPLAPDSNNAFTGGNYLVPSLAQLPQTAWYAKIKTRLKKIFVEAALTNSVGDFTLARVSPSAIGMPMPVPFGPGNETDGLRIQLISSSYSTTAFLINAGVEF
jgi:hypothetical protein